MKAKKWHLETLAFLAIYLFAIYLWTLPFQDNRIPYGEFDAISHWELADSFSQLDRTYLYLPPFVDYSYWNDNKFKPHTLWYHPPFHTDLGMVASLTSFTGERMVPVYLTNAIFASSILISVFFVIRKLFGFLPAILSEFLLVFSMRDIMPYLWGQWPERFGYAFLPLILYCFYVYYVNYPTEKAQAKKSKGLYLYILAILLSIQMMIHPLTFIHSMAGIFVLFVALAVKLRKIPFNIKHIIAALLIFVVLFAMFPYQSGNVIKSLTKKTKKAPDTFSFSRLFEWGPNPDYFKGSVPLIYFSFSEMHGLWTLPLLLIGLVILLLRREDRDIFLLAWLVSLYFILHRDAFGKWTFLHRSLSASAHIFVPITVIGAISMFSIFKMKNNIKAILSYSGALLVIILALVYNLPQAYSTLNEAYDSPIIRLNAAQTEAAQWMKENIPVEKNVSIAGPPPEIMQKVWWMASVSHRISNFFEGYLTWKTYENNRQEVISNVLINDYIVFDYSDIELLSERSFVEKWAAFEQRYMGNHTLLYNKNSIRVYKYETK